MFGLGGIIGDMVGAPFEFSRNMKTKDFLFLDKKYNIFTDDSVMTLALADAIMTAGREADNNVISDCMKKHMVSWGRKYSDAGYGGSFMGWLFSSDPEPYNSWGNGSAMRVGLIPWLYMDDLEKCLEMAETQAKLSHNHPEGIKGAVSIAHVTWLALRGVDKEEIHKVVCDLYYPLKESCEDIRGWYRFDVSCQGTCPVAIQCFLEAADYEDAVRLAVSMGGDADTLACIAGTMAEAYYGVPVRYQKIAMEILPQDLREIVHRLNDMLTEDMW